MAANTVAPGSPTEFESSNATVSLVMLGMVIRDQALRILAVVVLAGGVAWATTALMRPIFTAQATLLPPRQQQASTALASLGVLAGAVGSVVAHTGEQYVSFLRSRAITDRIVARFHLAADTTPAAQDLARRQLEQRTRFEVSRKDNLLVIAVNDHEPQRAADLATAFAEELRLFTHDLFRTAIADRLATVERELAASTLQLAHGESALYRSGIAAADLAVDARMVAERYGLLQAQLAQAEIRLQSLSAALSPQSPEMRETQATVAALQRLMARQEYPGALAGSESTGYTDLQRNYRQREQSHAALARLAETLRLEMTRGAPAIPTLDSAIAPQRASAPRQVRTTLLSAAAAGVIAMLVLVIRTFWRTRPQGRAAQWPA